jgi:cystathionine beta-synthase
LNVDFSLIDGFTKVTDKDATVREELRWKKVFSLGTQQELLLRGYAIKDHFKPEDVVVVLFHDSGSRYVGKMFNDDWMRERGFLKRKLKAEDVIKIILISLNCCSYRRTSVPRHRKNA